MLNLEPGAESVSLDSHEWRVDDKQFLKGKCGAVTRRRLKKTGWPLAHSDASSVLGTVPPPSQFTVIRETRTFMNEYTDEETEA